MVLPSGEGTGESHAGTDQITKRIIDRIESDGSDRFFWDRELPGFGLRVRASGRKFFVTQFRANGRLRRMTLGPATAMSPEEARRRADGPALRGQGREAIRPRSGTRIVR